MSMINLFKRMPAVCLVTAAVFLLMAPAAQAMKVQNQNLTALISDSQSIIFGTVKSVSDGFDPKGFPYTEITISVGSVAKGQIEAGSDYTFRQFGLLAPRVMPNGKTYHGVTPEGFATWNDGETIAAFMYKPASRTGLQTTAGMKQGKFNLVNGAFINGYMNSGLFDKVEIDNSLLSSEQQSMVKGTNGADAAAFADLVGRAVSEQWIEKGVMK